MKNKPSISTLFFDELLSAVEIIGINNTIKTLKEAKSKNKLILTDFDSLINIVSEVTNVEVERILVGTDRSDERKIAVALSVYFSKKQFKYSYSKLSELFNKDEGGLFRYNAMVENLPANPKNDFDKNLKNNFKKINLLISQRLNKK